MQNCNNGINIPTLETDPCNGERVSAGCVIDSSLYSELSLSANSTQQQINQAQYLASLNTKSVTDNLQTQIDILEDSTPDGSETKVTAGTNVSVTGVGTIASPYVVNSVDSRPYKVYTALITQQNTSAPTVIVLENTIGSISLVYNSVGYYSLSSVGLFTTDKTVGFITLSQGNTVLTLKPFTTNLITVLSFSGNGTTFINDAITNSSIEIRVYN